MRKAFIWCEFLETQVSFFGDFGEKEKENIKQSLVSFFGILAFWPSFGRKKKKKENLKQPLDSFFLYAYYMFRLWIFSSLNVKKQSVSEDNWENGNGSDTSLVSLQNLVTLLAKKSVQASRWFLHNNALNPMSMPKTDILPAKPFLQLQLPSNGWHDKNYSGEESHLKRIPNRNLCPKFWRVFPVMICCLWLARRNRSQENPKNWFLPSGLIRVGSRVQLNPLSLNSDPQPINF